MKNAFGGIFVINEKEISKEDVDLLEFRCNFCGNMKNVKLFKDKFICENCIKELTKINSIYKN